MYERVQQSKKNKEEGLMPSLQKRYELKGGGWSRGKKRRGRKGFNNAEEGYSPLDDSQ